MASPIASQTSLKDRMAAYLGAGAKKEDKRPSVGSVSGSIVKQAKQQLADAMKHEEEAEIQHTGKVWEPASPSAAEVAKKKADEEAAETAAAAAAAAAAVAAKKKKADEEAAAAKKKKKADEEAAAAAAALVETNVEADARAKAKVKADSEVQQQQAKLLAEKQAIEEQLAAATALAANDTLDGDLMPIIKAILCSLASLESKLENNAEEATAAASDVHPCIAGYDKYVVECVDPFEAACVKLGPGDISECGKVVKEAWAELRAFLVMSTECKKPAALDASLLGGLMEKMKAAQPLQKKGDWEKHAKTVGEGIAALNWICIEPNPREFIESYIGGSDYYANAIRKEFRTTNPDQVAFCDGFKGLLNGLLAYVKEFHFRGVTWNPKGCDVKEYKVGAGGAAPAAAAAAPAAAAPTATTTKAAAAPGGDLFAALNKGGAITGGLKTVTKDMQTWRTEFKGGDAPPAPAAPKAPPAAKVEVMKKPPSMEYAEAGNKWSVEYQVGNVEIVCKSIKDNIYIFGCVGAKIDVKSKCKSIILDGCKKTTITFDSTMASVEVVNCQRINVVCRESVPSVAIDKTDGIVVTLSATSLHTEVVASKSSEMNMSWPDKDGEMVERPIPEQYVHRIKDGAITANVSDLYGH